MLDNQRTQRYLTYLLLFVLLAAVLVGTSWHMITAAGYETADFAANSLLIQDAKHLKLIYGHYSRVGFNHPGPVILYVQAFGELLFHDWLHVVPQPFAGQLVAALLYNAAWAVVVFALVQRMAGALQALLFVAVFALVTLLIDPAIWTGIWFPHQYVIPYAAMLLSIAPLAYGRTDTLKALAVSSGFLLNGHASFIPMLGVVLIVMLAFNWIVSRKDPALRILSKGWLTTHRRAILVAVGILSLFLVPLLIATVKDFPGPLADYVRFGKQNKGNAFMDAVRFVLVFWGTGKMLAAGLLLAAVLAVLLLASRPASPAPAPFVPLDFTRAARALGLAFVAATIALLYYAKSGIDDLSQFYVAFFYYSVPAMSAALVALFLCRAFPASVQNAFAGVVALAVFAVSWPRIQEPVYTYNYNQPGAAELYERLRQLPGTGRIVLDLEQTPRTWGTVWGGTLALQAYAKRQHDDLVCINLNWHISNTRPAQCRPEEVAANRRYEVGEALDVARGEADIEAQDMGLYRYGAPHRPLSYVTVREQREYFRGILTKGWSVLEGDFVWTVGPVAQIDLPADPARGRKLTLDLGSFIPRSTLSQRAQVFVDGRPAGSMEWRYSEPRRRLSIDLGPDPGAAKRIELKIEKPLVPKQFGINEDTRELGLSLYGIKRN